MWKKNMCPLAIRLDAFIKRSRMSLKDISKKAGIPEFTLMRFALGRGLLLEDYANSLVETLSELESELPDSQIG